MRGKVSGDINRNQTDAPDAAVPPGCQVCGVRRFGICSALRIAELTTFADATRRRKIAQGDTIVFEEDEVTDYANIVAGVVKLTKLLRDGRQQIVGLQFAPEFIGKAFADNVPVSIEAATDVEICVFPKKELEQMMRQVPDFEHRLLQQTLSQLDEARAWMVTLGRKTAQEKVASLLCLLAEHIGTGEDQAPERIQFTLPLRRADIADFLGLTIETVSRQLTTLRKNGLIGIAGTVDVTILDAAALKHIADGN